MLIGLQMFMLFVNQLDDIGKGSFGIFECIKCVLFEMPYQVYLFFPMASLLGCLTGLGVLANNHELIVIRSAGYSIGKVSAAVLKGAMLVIVLTTFIGETVAPKLVEYAQDLKENAMFESNSLRKNSWIKVENDYIKIGKIISNTKLLDVYQFKIDNQHNLCFARHINNLEFKDGQWIASDVNESNFKDAKIITRQKHQEVWDKNLKPEVFTHAVLEPEEMTLPQLHQFLHSHEKISKTFLNYSVCYWQRLILPFTTAVMMILAIPFIFGPLRSSTMGSNLLTGAAIGFGFYILNRIFGTVIQVFQLPGMVAAISPTLFFAALGLIILRRSR